VPKDVHDVLTAQEAFYLVVQRVGVAILTKPTMTDTRAKMDVIVKPLADTALSFETCLVLRAHEESRFVNEFVRSYLPKYAPIDSDRLKWSRSCPPDCAPDLFSKRRSVTWQK
jgi:isocitrate dehydrogenase kinase/phosphatase